MSISALQAKEDAPMAPQTTDPIEFCPAAACAGAVVRLEGCVDQLSRLQEASGLSPQLMQALETARDDLILSADAARDRLSGVEAVSSAGAMAQLLAAIRDIRAGDEPHAARAKDLEAKAVRFLSMAGLYDARVCQALSGSRLGGRVYAPVRENAVRERAGAEA